MIVRTVKEIHEAHDLIDSILKGEVPPIYFDPKVEFTMQCVRTTLCWILGHETGEEFQENLDRYRQRVKDEGYEAKLIQ